MKNLLTILSISLLAGCAYFPLKPGRATMQTGRLHTEVRQSQNPQSSTTQKYERTTETPTGVKTTERNEVVIGAAQRDTAREMAAKLGSLKGVVWVGVLLFIFGVGSAVYPPLKIVVGGSITTSAVLAVAGIALIILPSLLVGHELLLLAVAGGGAGIYFFAHRHGGLKATVELLKKDLTPK